MIVGSCRKRKPEKTIKGERGGKKGIDKGKVIPKKTFTNEQMGRRGREKEHAQGGKKGSPVFIKRRGMTRGKTQREGKR